MINLSRREHEVKLELISSIARSQFALARILDSIASISDCSPNLATRIGENMRILTELQEKMTESVTGLSLRHNRVRNGKPVKPWINSRVCSMTKHSVRRRRRKL
ncbi:MAG: hypothetical protein ACE3L7_32080 [Candidatus Pristimantibacillus sp.]